MPDSTRPLARHLISAVLRHGSGAGPPDRDLLGRFVAGRDEEAFAELVRRHGAMVLSVTRRVTGHAQDAEDAFQAAFLVLARRAGQVTRPELLGNWLYGVAYRTALEARAARRRVKELQPVSDTPEPAARSGAGPEPGSPEAADLRRVIDEELAALPDKYRSAVVLCDLEGLSRRDAAARLKVPEGTLSSRLNHARRLLAGRLSRRGVTTTAGAVAAAFTGDAAGTTVSSQLVHSTARAAARFAAGGTVPAGCVSSQVTTLTDGVMKAMIVSRLRLTLGAAVLALGLIGTAAALAQRPTNVQPYNPYGGGVQPNPYGGAGQEGRFAPPAGKAPEKIPAKGIEDEDVPYPSFPAQAVVRLEEGRLVVRQRGRAYAPSTNQRPDGQWVTSYQLTTSVGGQKYDPSDVSVFDMKGNRVATKVWKEKLKEDRHALVAFDGRLPHPRELALFRDDVLLIVFPGHPGADSAAPAGYRLRYYYEPATPPADPLLAPPAVTDPPPPSPALGPFLPPATGPDIVPPTVPAPPPPSPTGPGNPPPATGPAPPPGGSLPTVPGD